MVAPALGREPHQKLIRVLDRCDPETFDAVFGEGTCVPTSRGDVTFERFITRLDERRARKVLQSRSLLGWVFKPSRTRAREGDSLLVDNRGGEFHTFTNVTETGFGGGCVPELNEILGLTPLPQCTTDANGDGSPDAFDPGSALPAGDSFTVSDLSHGRNLFECLIHPWMRTTVRVRR